MKGIIARILITIIIVVLVGGTEIAASQSPLSPLPRLATVSTQVHPAPTETQILPITGKDGIGTFAFLMAVILVGLVCLIVGWWLERR